MHEQRDRTRWTRYGTIAMQLAAIGLVVVVGWLVGGGVMAIGLGSGVAVAVFSCDMIVRRQRRQPQPSAAKATPLPGVDQSSRRG